MKLGDWLQDNPRARPLLMFALFGVVLLMVGVLLGLSKKKKDPLVSEVTTRLVSDQIPDGSHTGVPLSGGEEQLGQPARRRKVAWIRDKDVSGKAQAGFDVPTARKFQQWEEVSWIRENEGWDLVRGSDGQELWVQSKYIVWARPANLEKPSEAELTIMRFYEAVARKDYTAAYSYLSPAWKSELDFNRFVEGYSRTLNLRTEISRVIPLGAQRFQVDLTQSADELGQEVPYEGSYTIEKVADDWLMTSGNLNRATRAASPARQVGIPDTPPPVKISATPPAEADPTPAEVLSTPSPEATPF